MTTKYVKPATAKVSEKADGKTQSMVLIHGDEVAAIEEASAGMTRIESRGKEGYIKTKALGSKASLEIYCIDVGTGDATFIVTPGRKKILIDGGLNKRALGFLAWKYRLDQPDAPTVAIELLVLSHADDDHLKGLIPIVQHPKIEVKRVIHSGIARYAQGAFATELGDLSADEKHLLTRHSGLADLAGAKLSKDFEAWRKAIEGEGGAVDYAAVSRATGAIDLGDPSVQLEVLGPNLEQAGGQPAYRWFADTAHTINGHSVVLRLTHGAARVLLPGDLNEAAEDYLLETPGLAAKFNAHVFKAPHHGSHEYSKAFLEKVKPQISVISAGDDRDHGHPRACFLGAVGQASRSERPLVFATEIAGNFTRLAKEEEPPPPASANPDAKRRLLFKRRLHGMINVRSDGASLYAARRVASGYWWEAYGPIPAA